MAEFLESEALVTATVQSGTESDGSAEILLQETPSRTTGRGMLKRLFSDSSSDFEEEETFPAKKTKRKKDKDLLAEMKKTNAMMLSLVEKVKKTDRRVRAMEEQLKIQNSKSPDSSTPKRPLKRDVPDEVRVLKYNKLHSYT